MAQQLQLDFSNAETQRDRVTQAQQKHIRDLYKAAAEDIRKRAEKAPRVPSDALHKEYLNKLQGQINDALKQIEGDLRGSVKDSMRSVAAATVKDAQGFAKDLGLNIKGSYSHVPVDIVRSVASGQLYSGDWSLSKALWLNTKETQQDVQNIVTKGIIENKSAYDIAKDLEKYVDPTARKDWDWSKVYPGTRKVVDYNAQRLARTMVSHAYQQAFVRTTQKNPFVTKYQWEASNSERTCQLCLDRDGQYYKKDELPLDHPNGMCTFIAVIEDDMDTIADRLADWVHGADDPALDGWAKDMYGKEWENKKQEAQAKQDKEKATIRDAKWVDKTYKNLKKQIETVYGKETWEALRQDIVSKPEHIQDWIQRWTGKVTLAQDGDKGYQRGMMIYENMVKDAQGERGRLPFSTFYHELGHYTDMMYRGGSVASSGKGEGSTFYALLEKEYRKLLVPTGSSILGPLQPDIHNSLRSNDNTSGVQDTISGLSGNANRVKWGHSNEYWNRKEPWERWKEVTNETFADMYMAYCMPGSDQEKAFQQYFPESYQYFKDTWVNQPDKFYAKG